MTRPNFRDDPAADMTRTASRCAGHLSASRCTPATGSLRYNGDSYCSYCNEGGGLMATDTLEERVALLEREVLTLKRQLPGPSAVPWWEQISGVFADVPAFDEAA